MISYAWLSTIERASSMRFGILNETPDDEEAVPSVQLVEAAAGDDERTAAARRRRALGSRVHAALSA